MGSIYTFNNQEERKIENTVDIRINDSVLNKVPTLFVSTRIISDVYVNKDSDPGIEKRKTEIFAEWTGATDKQLDSNPLIIAYRELQMQMGSDPKKSLPAVEGMLKRGVLQNRFPRINSAVDIANIVSLTHLVPIGLFDFEKINGDIELTLAATNDQFIPIGKDTPVKISSGTAILKDSDGIFSAVGSRDSKRTMITSNTKNILTFSWGMVSVGHVLISDVLDKCSKEILKYSKYKRTIDTSNHA